MISPKVIESSYTYPSTEPMLELPRYETICCCSNCGLRCNRERVGVEDCRPTGRCITLMFCDHCDMGWESLRGVRHRSWEHEFTIGHQGGQLAAFLKRLEKHACIAP